MICTCTLNPSLDYYMEFDHRIEHGRTNRSQLEYYEAGGKGINVSIVLNNLLIPTRAFGFLGGFTREFYVTLLQKYEYIQPNFTYIDGHTRINVKLHDTEGDSDVNAAGPYITSSDMDNLRNKVLRLDEGDYFVLAGASPEYLTKDIIGMLKSIMKNKVKVVLDTSPEIIRGVLDDKPFLIKSTPEELNALAKLANAEVKGHDDAVEYAKKIKKAGAHNVIVVDKNEKAVLACADGTYECEITRNEKTVSTVGTGDSLVAGFLMNYLRTSNEVDSFRFGSCCGSATAYSKGLATREKIDSFYESTKVEKIG